MLARRRRRRHRRCRCRCLSERSLHSSPLTGAFASSRFQSTPCSFSFQLSSALISSPRHRRRTRLASAGSSRSPPGPFSPEDLNVHFQETITARQADDLALPSHRTLPLVEVSMPPRHHGTPPRASERASGRFQARAKIQIYFLCFFFLPFSRPLCGVCHLASRLELAP